MAEQKFFSDDEMKSLRFMMEEQKCTPDEIEIMISRIRGDIREYYISKEVHSILLVSLDYDLCSAILTILFEDLFPKKVSAILQRLKMYDHYFQSGFVEKAMKIARNLERDIRTRVELSKKKHPNGKVFGVNGSFAKIFPLTFRIARITMILKQLEPITTNTTDTLRVLFLLETTVLYALMAVIWITSSSFLTLNTNAGVTQMVMVNQVVLMVVMI